MKCNKCGTEVNPQDEFCYNCGAQITRKKENKKDKQKKEPEVQEYKLKDKEIEKLSQSFASRDEKYIASLGNGYIMNYLTNGSMNKGFAFITDKRVYFKGSCLSGTGKNLVKTNEERTVDVKNITGSGFTYHRYWGILIALFISLFASIAVGVFGGWLSQNIYLPIHVDLMSDDVDIHSSVEKEYLEETLNILDELEWRENGDMGYIIQSEDDYFHFFLTFDENSISCCRNSPRINFVLYYDKIGESISAFESPADINEKTKKLIEYEIEQCKEYLKRVDARNRVDAIEQILVMLAKMLSAALSISLVIACCIGIKNYLLKRKTLFRIEYAGGCIAFDVSFYAKAEIDDFQKQLRRVKDFAEETSTIKPVAVETPTQTPVQTASQNSVPDDLRKYADLLKDGLISQEEYDAMKRKILGL